MIYTPPQGIIHDTDPRIVCAEGYARSHRKTTASMKRRVYELFQVSPAERHGVYALDHYFPIELGGEDAVGNLWPQERPNF
jgi:hypothetical protein